MRGKAILFVGLFVMLMSGCGGGPAAPKREFAEVKGKISVKGKPVKAGSINFQPPSGAPVVASIGTDGTYQLQGVIGHNIVLIFYPPPAQVQLSMDPAQRKADSQAAAKAMREADIPQHYSLPAGGLKFDIKAGVNTADFDLK